MAFEKVIVFGPTGNIGSIAAQTASKKGAKVYLASARAQIAKDVPVPEAGEESIEASRRRGGPPKEPPDEKIGATGFVLD